MVVKVFIICIFMYSVDDNSNGHRDSFRENSFHLKFDVSIDLIELLIFGFRFETMSDEEKKTAEWSNIKSLHADRFVETQKPMFDLKTMHPEAQKRLNMLGFLTTNADGEQQQASNDEIDAILHKSIQNEDPNILADKYMMQHNLYELFKVNSLWIIIAMIHSSVFSQ